MPRNPFNQEAIGDANLFELVRLYKEAIKCYGQSITKETLRELEKVFVLIFALFLNTPKGSNMLNSYKCAAFGLLAERRRPMPSENIEQQKWKAEFHYKIAIDQIAIDPMKFDPERLVNFLCTNASTVYRDIAKRQRSKPFTLDKMDSIIICGWVFELRHMFLNSESPLNSESCPGFHIPPFSFLSDRAAVGLLELAGINTTEEAYRKRRTRWKLKHSGITLLNDFRFERGFLALS